MRRGALLRIGRWRLSHRGRGRRIDLPALDLRRRLGGGFRRLDRRGLHWRGRRGLPGYRHPVRLHLLWLIGLRGGNLRRRLHLRTRDHLRIVHAALERGRGRILGDGARLRLATSQLNLRLFAGGGRILVYRATLGLRFGRLALDRRGVGLRRAGLLAGGARGGRGGDRLGDGLRSGLRRLATELRLLLAHPGDRF